VKAAGEEKVFVVVDWCETNLEGVLLGQRDGNGLYGIREERKYRREQWLY
jgi:hypothetical protein